MRKRLASVLVACGLATAAEARAQDGPFSPDSFHGLAEVRLTSASGERSWLDREFGKTSPSGDEVEIRLSEAALEWKPRFNFALSGVVQATPSCSSEIGGQNTPARPEMRPTGVGSWSLR